MNIYSIVRFISFSAVLSLGFVIVFGAKLALSDTVLVPKAVPSIEALKQEALKQSAKEAPNNADIKRAENYLRTLKTLKADFKQKAQNGARLSGTFYLSRPGKLRFEYNEIEDFIVADGLFIYFFDSELREQTNAPIGQTLADFLLRKDVNFDGDVKVIEIGHSDGHKTYTLAQSDDVAAGTVTLFFDPEPFTLKKWTVTDAAGLTTEIELSNIETGLDFESRLFAFIHPDHGKTGYNE